MRSERQMMEIKDSLGAVVSYKYTTDCTTHLKIWGGLGKPFTIQKFWHFLLSIFLKIQKFLMRNWCRICTYCIGITKQSSSKSVKIIIFKKKNILVVTYFHIHSRPANFYGFCVGTPHFNTGVHCYELSLKMRKEISHLFLPKKNGRWVNRYANLEWLIVLKW